MTSSNVAMTTVLNGICLGAIVAAAMMLILKCLRRLNSTTRFTVLWMTLLGVVALLVPPLIPRVSLAKPRIESVAVSASPAVIPATAWAEVYWPGRKAHASDGEAVSLQNTASRSEQRLESKTSPEPSTNPVPGAPPSEHSLIRIHSAKFPRAMAIVWAVLSLVLLARLTAGYCVLRKLKSSATP